MIEFRNIPYNPPPLVRPTEIVASAILVEGRIWTGKRHYTLIQQAVEDLGEGTKVFQEQQGFWTNDNRFLTRKQALAIVLSNGQLKREDMINKGVLTSEDLWE